MNFTKPRRTLPGCLELLRSRGVTALRVETNDPTDPPRSLIVFHPHRPDQCEIDLTSHLLPCRAHHAWPSDGIAYE